MQGITGQFFYCPVYNLCVNSFDNRSDDRSGQVVQNKIRDLLRWQSAYKKPNILIIDEVDGAIGGGEQVSEQDHQISVVAVV